MMQALLSALEWADDQRQRPPWISDVCSLVEDLQHSQD